MAADQYWMGKNLDLDALWADFDNGRPYEAKVGGSQLHLLRLSFAGHPVHLPLFDHEVIYKTVKGTFHDVKAECFTPAAYSAAAPIFLHRIERGSGVFEFLGQLSPLLTWIVALGGAASWYRANFVSDEKLDQAQLAFLRGNFPGVSEADAKAYLKAWTTFGRRRVLYRLIDCGLRRVEVSRSPVTQVEAERPLEMVDMKRITGDASADGRDDG